MTRRAFYLALILIAALYAFAAFVFVGAAHAAMYACAGAPANYVKHFDGVRGQLVDGNVRYPEKRFWLEWQSWLTPVGQVPGHHSEHIHIAACVPQGETWLSPNDNRHLDIEFTFHNVVDYQAVKIQGSFVTKAGSRAAFELADTFAPLADINAAMNASGVEGATKAYASLPVRPSISNGFKEMRWGLKVVEDGAGALVPEWELDARWYVTDAYAGLPAVEPIDAQVRYIRLRSIVVHFFEGARVQGYHHSGWCNTPEARGSDEWNRDLLYQRAPDSWYRCLRATDGGGPASLEINPNHHFHPDNRGAWFSDFPFFTPQFVEQTVPLGSLNLGTTAWHKLVFLSHDEPDCVRLNRECPPDVRPIWTNVNVLPFRVS